MSPHQAADIIGETIAELDLPLMVEVEDNTVVVSAVDPEIVPNQAIVVWNTALFHIVVNYGANVVSTILTFAQIE